MNRRYFAVSIGMLSGLLIVFLVLMNISLRGNSVKITTIGGRYFRSEIVTSPAKLSLGLGQRNRLCGRCAMLFLFQNDRPHVFWMKGMRFPLDIIWISDGKIAAIEKNIPASSEELYNPLTPSDAVLEVNAGLVDRLGWKVGDQISW